MKIKEFSIRRYGPLPDLGKITLRDFNLFWGKNEEGKTLMIDALVRLLLGRNIRDFKHIDRVEENPEGYVVIESDKGKEVKLPEKGDLTKVARLTPSECRNIFVIRNSDLSIASESEFYTDVTARLTGLRTEDIRRIEETLREIGKITPGDDFRDIKDEKLKTRIGNAKNLVREIESLAKVIKGKRFDQLEEEAARYRKEIDCIKQEIEKLEDARKREIYEKGKEALDKLKEHLKGLKDLENYKEDDYQLWWEGERNIKQQKERLSEEVNSLKEKEKELKEISEKLSKMESDFQVFNERKKKIDEEIRPDLRNYETKSKEVAQQEEKSKFFTSLGIISATLLVISLLGTIFRPSLLFYIVGVLSLISVVISGIIKFQFVRDKDELAELLERIKLNISKFELAAENIEGIFSNIQKFDEEYYRKNEELQEIRRKEENLKEKINELRDKIIPKIRFEIKSNEEKINRVKRNLGEESLEEYRQKLESKKKFERLIGEQRSILKSLFGEKSEKENILHWNNEIENLEKYKDKAKDIEYSETSKSKLKEKKEEDEGRLERINEMMVSLQREMEEVERKANEILRLEGERLYCKTSADLKEIEDRLQAFIKENENNRDNVIEVIKIFKEIEAEEKEKVSKLFGRESPISKYFKEITDGLYEEVTFNQEAGEIEVKRNDGVIIGAEKLSGGAYDQLYFSIRLALGERLLKGEKGFFIIDDPFIKADPNRLQRQIETLKKISKSGWQVIYFSAKGEIKDALREDIEKGFIHYVEVKGIFSKNRESLAT